MDKPSIGARLRYRFDNLMARGNVAVIGLLGLISLAWIIVIGLVAFVFSIHPTDQDERYSFVEGTWRQLTFTLDPGTFSGDVGWAWRIASLLTTLFGVLVVASLIGVVSAAFDDQIAQLRKGRSSVLEHGHTVILGWNTKVFTIISELVIANESEHKPVVVVLADRDRVDMEEAIREKVADLKNTKVVCRSGNPLDQDELLRANPYAAKSLIVLGDEDAADVDATTIKTTLALTNHPERPEGEITVVGEIANPENLSIAKLVGKDEAEWILPLETISKVTVQTCRQSGLSRVYTELLQFDGDEMYFTEQPSLTGRSYLDAQLAFETSTVVGVITESGVVMNPPASRPLADGEQLIVIAEDDSTIELAATPGTPAEAAVTGMAAVEDEPERTLILGSHSQLPLIVSELNEYAPAGSHVTIVTEYKAPKFAEAPNLDIVVKRGDTTDRKTIEDLQPHTFDHILVLAYRDNLDIETADSRTLVTLLQLRELSAESGTNLNIVSEMLDDRNRRLAEVTKADDFIVSDNLISLMMAQISENPQLNEVYGVLFSSDGPEIYLRPAEWYVTPGVPVDFYTVAAGAARRGETAIGFRDVAPDGVGDARATIRINPAKSEQRVYGPGDLIIVLAED
ncbi:CASTOR/POLLUX-related putative ion channel [Demequina sp.]|uniref:CASTOR/POLLUX-related putative ion channel n=1 Tax=Demequina sp. TaxID=2050685 RepID=UPI003D0A2580